jgi:hypothetical protein
VANISVHELHLLKFMDDLTIHDSGTKAKNVAVGFHPLFIIIKLINLKMTKEN